MKKSIFYILIAVSFLFSCVPARKYQEISDKATRFEKSSEEFKNKSKMLTEENTELEETKDKYIRKYNSSKEDNGRLSNSLHQMTSNYDRINETYQLLLDKNKELLRDRKTSTNRLMSDLNITKEDLRAKEDALQVLDESLRKKQEHISLMEERLEEREQRVKELQAMIDKKDSILNSIKDKIKQALVGVEEEGIKVEKKNNGIYVSLDEKLLFKSGNYFVEKTGKKILKKLSKVFSKTKDINIVVEGHTDNVPLKSSGPISDNWDLSVRRATSVVKLLVKGGLLPKRVTASGRGEYLPLSDNSSREGRAKNRRIEIIIAPNLDQLYDILN